MVADYHHAPLGELVARVGEAVDRYRAGEHGWVTLFADRYPYAGGPEHYAVYLEDSDGYEVEPVAS